MTELQVDGYSLIAGVATSQGGEGFEAENPVTGEKLPTMFRSARTEDLDLACRAAEEAFSSTSKLASRERAAFLARIADGLTVAGPAIIERAHQETGLPLARLNGELARTTGQLHMFAETLLEGSWCDARIDVALPDRKPLPRADIRSMLRPLGPVAVFGASNFPLAFSVAGGDTASAFAAGNPVIVKAHPAHPGTSELVARVIASAVEGCGLPGGTFSLLFDAGTAIGSALVQHPAVKAVAFTGSANGGQALMKLAASRPEPIPCFAEMGSTNPLFILPGAQRERGAALAKGLQASFTLGSGQFCTKPGLVFVPAAHQETFLTELQEGVSSLQPLGMLTRSMAVRYDAAVQNRSQSGGVTSFGVTRAEGSTAGAAANAALFSVALHDFVADPNLEDEIFGPATLLIHYESPQDLLAAARGLRGHLTATIHGTVEDLEQATELVHVLEHRVGRILFNGFPTGVEVCPAMVHGGPYPSTSDGRSTSVGTRAMLRFTRPVCYQDFPDSTLPLELQSSNPLGIVRLVNGKLTRDSVVQSSS